MNNKFWNLVQTSVLQWRHLTAYIQIEVNSGRWNWHKSE